MKCLVTGGAGFIGSNLVDELVREGHDVLVFDNMSTGKEENKNPDAIYVKIDISKDFNGNLIPGMKWEIENFGGIDYIFHLAAAARVQPSIDDPVDYNNKNVNGLLHMLEIGRIFNVKKFIFSSSSSVYGDTDKLPSVETDELQPLSPYAAQKLIGEIYCKLYSEVYGLPTICLRYFNVYGERQPLKGAYALVMGIFAQQKLEGVPMTINGDGKQRRDFTYVGDVVKANILAALNSEIGYGEIFNIGNGDNRSVNQIANMIGGNIIHREPVIEPRETLANNEKAKNILGWEPTMLIEDWIPTWSVLKSEK